jgi:phosphoglycolate phosphatase-like HAD superfamily hydrolase
MRKASFSLVAYLFLTVCLSLFAYDPLPSWNEGKAKQAIMEFVQRTTSLNENEYIPVEERVATFDQDGTLWTEKPIYTQFSFAISRIKELAKKHPEWTNQQPFQAILEGDVEKMQQFTLQDIETIIAATHAGMTTVEFQKYVTDWLKVAKHPRFEKPYTELIYQPMLELIQYLQDHQYRVYIVSGGGQDFIRVYSTPVYGIPVEQVIGSAGKTHYESRITKPVLVKLPEILLIDDKSGKPEAIHLFIGKQPVLAAGNSDGDREMLEWAQTGKRRSLQLLVHHDDDIREYAYDVHSKIGTFSESLRNEAINNNWIIVSMKNDWRRIFAFGTCLR